MKPIVLVPVRYFLPAYKAGGPVRTLQAMIQHLSSTYQFRVLALDRDLGEHSPFPSIRRNEWNQAGPAVVRYFAPNLMLPFRLVKALRNTEFSILYLNSFFDPMFTLVPLLARRLGLIPDKPVIIAPRGELSPGALAQKRLKKLIFLRVAQRLGLFRNAILHASTELEKREIQETLGWRPGDLADAAMGGTTRKSALTNKLEIRVARDMVSLASPGTNARTTKAAGRLNAVFISRVSPKKNLVAAIEMLNRVKGSVSFHIYGPIDDSGYWQKCQQVVEQCGDSMRVEYKGVLTHDRVLDTFALYDAFVFPTLGENFGHVILESLLAGCPVMTSDQTPWADLQTARAGWNLPLGDAGRFVQVLQMLADMNETEFQSLRAGAKALGLSVLNDQAAFNDNLELFRRALSRLDDSLNPGQPC